MDNQFFPLTLVSNVEGANNSLAQFTTTLPRDISLEGQWSVGLSEIQYTKSWFNINKYYSVGITDDKFITFQSPEKVVPGMYESPQNLISEINRCVVKAGPSVVSGKTRLQKEKNLTNLDEILTCPRLDYNTSSRRVTMHAGKTSDGRKLFINMEPDLKGILGMTRDDEEYDTENNIEVMNVDINQETLKGEQDAFFVYDLHCGIHSLMVYCDLIKPIITGNTYTQLLRSVPVTHRKFGDQCCVTFTKPYFFPLATNSFRTIDISIRDDTGVLIPFKFGRTIVVLEFKKL